MLVGEVEVGPVLHDARLGLDGDLGALGRAQLHGLGEAPLAAVHLGAVHRRRGRRSRCRLPSGADQGADLLVRLVRDPHQAENDVGRRDVAEGDCLHASSPLVWFSRRPRTPYAGSRGSGGIVRWWAGRCQWTADQRTALRSGSAVACSTAQRSDRTPSSSCWSALSPRTHPAVPNRPDRFAGQSVRSGRHHARGPRRTRVVARGPRFSLRLVRSTATALEAVRRDRRHGFGDRECIVGQLGGGKATIALLDQFRPQDRHRSLQSRPGLPGREALRWVDYAALVICELGSYGEMAEEERPFVEPLSPQPSGHLVVALARIACPACGNDVVQGVPPAPGNRQKRNPAAAHCRLLRSTHNRPRLPVVLAIVRQTSRVR